MPSTRSGGKTSKSPQKKSTSRKKQSQHTKTKSTSNSSTTRTAALDEQMLEDEDDSTIERQPKKSTIFQSRFPGLELDTFEQELDNWTLVSLQEAIVSQDSRRSTAHKDIKDLVQVVRMEFEKRILMIALMAGVPEVVIWNLVGMGTKKVKANPWIRFLSFCFKCLGAKLPNRDDKDAWVKRNQEMAEIWHDLDIDQQTVFKDPYFFSLANLPDYSITSLPDDGNVIDDENENGVDTSNFDTPAVAPKVHQLSDEDKMKYQPIFDQLVNVEKVHLCHGKPEPSPSVAALQKRSQIAVRKAHHDFSVVCQQHQISYYLTSASCGGADGWSQTFSNNLKFAEWAFKTSKIPKKFATYVHGKEVAKEIEGKVPQPSDKRKSILCHQLNDLLNVHMPGKPFPKGYDPVGYIQKKNWPIQIVRKPGSLLNDEDLLPGHRDITDAIVRLWSKDIENGLFLIEAKVINPTQTNSHNGTSSKKRKHRSQKTSHDTTQKRPRHNNNSSNNALSNNPGPKSEYVARLKALAEIKDKKAKKVRGQAGPSLKDNGSDTEESDTEKSESEKSESEKSESEKSETEESD